VVGPANASSVEIAGASLRILALSAFYPPDTVGGYEWAAFEVLTRLAARGHEVDVLAGLPDGACESLPRVSRILRRVQVRDSAQTSGARYEALKAYCYNYQTVLRAVERLRPDLLYVWSGANLTPAVMAAVESSGRPAVFHLEDTWLLQARDQGGAGGLAGAASRLVRSLLAALPRFESAAWPCLFVSAALQRQYADAGWHPGRALVVHNGIDADATPRTWPAAGPQTLRLGYVGRLRENKGLGLLLEALSLCHADGWRDFCLEIFGTGDNAFAARQRAYAEAAPFAERVRWMGGRARAEILRAYRELDLLVVPSLWEEPFGLVAIEAMAAGVPVVATRRGGLAEIITEDCGWLCDPDPRALADALRVAAATPGALAAKGRAAHARVCERFAWADKIDAIEAFLRAAHQDGA